MSNSAQNINLIMHWEFEVIETKCCNQCLRSYVMVILLRDVQLTLGREDAMLQTPRIVLFEFLTCNKNILQTCNTILQKIYWVLNKLICFTIGLSVQTKKSGRWNWPCWEGRHVNEELWNSKLLLISWALGIDSVHLFWLSWEAARLTFLCLGSDGITNINPTVLSNLQPMVTSLANQPLGWNFCSWIRRSPAHQE